MFACKCVISMQRMSTYACMCACMRITRSLEQFEKYALINANCCTKTEVSTQVPQSSNKPRPSFSRYVQIFTTSQSLAVVTDIKFFHFVFGFTLKFMQSQIRKLLLWNKYLTIFFRKCKQFGIISIISKTSSAPSIHIKKLPFHYWPETYSRVLLNISY